MSNFHHVDFSIFKKKQNNKEKFRRINQFPCQDVGELLIYFYLKNQRAKNFSKISMNFCFQIFNT